MYVIATQLLTQPPTKPQPLALFAIFRGQKWPLRPHSTTGYNFFGKLINFVSYHFFKLLVIYWSFLTLMVVVRMKSVS